MIHYRNRTLQHLLLFGMSVATFNSYTASALLPFIDGGKGMPDLTKGYKGYFDSQIAKQASTALSKCIAAGNTKVEVNFPPVPNLDEVRFGTPLNKNFGTNIVAKELKVKGGYKPGSDLSRQQVAFANIYWAKQLAGAAAGGFGRKATVVSAEPVTVTQIQSKGDIGALLPLQLSRAQATGNGCIAVNPGGEETWERVRQAYCSGNSKKAPFVVLNNAYSTTYGLGNQRSDFEEAYYLKRISKGWVFRAFPGPWQAYLEKPDASVELLKSYSTKPQLKDVAALVRDESFKRYAINNDRWSKGFGERM